MPCWAKDATVGLRMINARAESLLEKRGVQAKAALRPGAAWCRPTGWYEWQVSPTAIDAKGKPRKQPFFIHRSRRADRSPSPGSTSSGATARIADDDDPAAWLTTFTIITTAAEPGLDRIHDRQPLVLERERLGGLARPRR